MSTNPWSMRNLLDISWLIFLVLILGYFLRYRQQLLKSKKWPTTTARITQCEWEKEAPYLWPKIGYLYHVDGQDYTGERLFLDMKHIDPNSQFARLLAYKIIVAYQQNMLIDVHYNPENPSESVLDTTVPRKINFILGFVAALTALHLIMVSIHLHY